MCERQRPGMRGTAAGGRRTGVIGVVALLWMGWCSEVWSDVWGDVWRDHAFSGYYKNLFVASQTLPAFGPQERTVLDLNRLRLRLRGGVGDAVDYDLQYDNEILWGSYLETRQSAFQEALEPETYFDWEDAYVRRGQWLGRHRLYRAHLTFRGARSELRIGRQRLAWGTALFWNPMDLLNPFDPIQLEREERPGVDAVQWGWDYGVLSRLTAVYARQRGGSSGALRWRSHWRGFDLALTGGRFRGDEVLGFDFAGQAGLVGLRGELTGTRSAQDGDYARLVLGADRSFANTLTLNLELYYNGRGQARSRDYAFARLLGGELLSLARYYAGFFAAYDFTPILRGEAYAILNLDDASRFFAPRLVYGVSDDLDWSLGAQLFDGPSGSEYGRLESLFYSELQWFF